MMMPSYVFDLYDFRLSRYLQQNGRVLAGPDAAIAAESRIASDDIQFLQASLALNRPSAPTNEDLEGQDRGVGPTSYRVRDARHTLAVGGALTKSQRRRGLSAGELQAPGRRVP